MCKSQALKLPFLLTQFLYKNKKLTLPGIGIFTLDPSAVIPDGHDKEQHEKAIGIEFKNANVLHADDELIEFIRQHTGKIKPLAIADLDSYLTLGTELLNIGKPFYLEGIGTLTKTQEGKFEFTRGEYSTARLEEQSHEKTERLARRKQPLEEVHQEPAEQASGGRKTLVLFAILGGLVIVGWGGYLLYKKNTQPPKENSVLIQDTTKANVDSLQAAKLFADSVSAARQKDEKLKLAMKDSVMYKFVILRTHNKERALKRYNQLLSYQLKINLWTEDSTYFKVYFSFPALPKDTSRIKESLESEYAHSVFIER